MITKKEVQHIAKLARLGVTEKEVEKFQKDLSSILKYIEKLKEVDISKTEVTGHPLEIENSMKPDKAEGHREETAKKLLDLAPETKDGYIQVKSVFK